MPSRNRQKARNKPQAKVRRRLASAGGFVGTETKRACGEATGSGWRKRWYSLVWVNRKRVFNDAAMINRHVIGTVFVYFGKENKCFSRLDARKVNQGGTYPIEPRNIIVFAIHVFPADIRLWNRPDLGDTYAEVDEM